jgi:hypothetical protein
MQTRSSNIANSGHTVKFEFGLRQTQADREVCVVVFNLSTRHIESVEMQTHSSNIANSWQSEKFELGLRQTQADREAWVLMFSAHLHVVSISSPCHIERVEMQTRSSNIANSWQSEKFELGLRQTQADREV